MLPSQLRIEISPNSKFCSGAQSGYNPTPQIHVSLSWLNNVQLNQSGLLGIQNILSRIELRSLIEVLEDGKYIQSISGPEMDAKRLVAKEENPYFVLGPRSFIDLKNWIEQKSDYSQFECPLCSDYVLHKGFRCGDARCPGTLHKHCIETYFQSVTNRNYKCPSCQTVCMQDLDGLEQFIQPLCHPNDAIAIVKNLKGRAAKFEPVPDQSQNRNESDSDDDSLED